MPRLRNRVRRRVAAPIGEPPDGEQEEPEDESDSEEQESELGRPDATVRALREDAYRRRTGSGGELGDIAPSEISDLSQQVTTGTAASVSIADQFDPGFTRTEIVNRLGMVLSLSFSYDYGAGEWVPDPIDKTESQAIQQQLAEDKATDNVEDVVDPGDNTQTNSDGDLELSEDRNSDKEWGHSGPTTTSTTDISGVQLELDRAIDSFTGRIDPSVCTATHAYVSYYFSNDTDDVPINSDGTFTISWPSTAGYTPNVWVYAQGDSYQTVEYKDTDLPIQRDGYSITDGRPPNEGNRDYPVALVGTDAKVPAEEGTAKSTFDNPCTASSVRSAQYDVCSRSSDVTIDLFEGDPDDPDSILLRDDISQREDIVDIPDSRTDLQYRIKIERGPDGDSPKVSRLGHQLIR